MLDCVLEIRKLTCKFGGLVALDSFDAEVRTGEILGIIGPNGAGKSVLINLITKFYTPTAGDVVFCNQSLKKLGQHKVARLGIARTFQNVRLFKRMTVLENVMVAHSTETTIGFRALISRNGASRRESEHLLETLGLTAYANQLAGTLAYGHARRLEIARAMATKPKLLLLDEPAAGMNEKETHSLVEDLRKVATLTQAVVLVEHDMALIRSLSSRLIAMNFGKKICEGPVEQVLNHDEVKTAYLGAIGA